MLHLRQYVLSPLNSVPLSWIILDIRVTLLLFIVGVARKFDDLNARVIRVSVEND